MHVPTLPAGTTLAERFELLYELGSGSFTLAYVAKDRVRGDRCVVKELAPEGVNRDERGVLDLTQMGANAQHLRQRFQEEARQTGRLHLPAILPVRAAFNELGTAYFVTDFIEGAMSLDHRLLTDGRLGVAETKRILEHLLDTLGPLHERGILHLNIKPGNILLSAAGRVYLVDFSAAREWYADATVSHHVLFDSPYAAPEQLTDRLDRGAATDIYGLCASLFHALTGKGPPHSEALAAGEALPRVASLRPEVDRRLADAIDQGLRLNYHDRPPTIEVFRELTEEKPGDFVQVMQRLERCDEMSDRIRRFRFEPRQCPACKDVLTHPQPLPKGMCPVCHSGRIKVRLLSERFCPVCTSGVLRERPNSSPLALCPICQVGLLDTKKKKPLAKERLSICRNCDATFEIEGDTARLIKPPPEEGQEAQRRTWNEWRELSGRPDMYFACDTCRAQFDLLKDGRLKQIWPAPGKYKVLYPDEWAKVGAGLDPASGNAECDSCRADFHIDAGSVTLLHTYRDPFGFASRHLGRLLKMDDLRWKGGGKESMNPGLICESCPTEFDFELSYLKLIRTDSNRLRALIGQSRTLEDWHRIADGLPTADHEPEFEREFSQVVVEAYEIGELSFEEQDDEQVLWRGPAIRLQERQAELEETGTGQLLVTSKEISFGGIIRKWRVAFERLIEASAEDRVITLVFEGEPAPILFELVPIEFTVRLEHGSRTVELAALNLALRLMRAAKPGTYAL